MTNVSVLTKKTVQKSTTGKKSVGPKDSQAKASGLGKADASVKHINALHGKYTKSYKDTLSLAVKIGELLVAKKSELKHGEWLKWTKTLDFTSRTASNYMRIYKNEDRFKSENVSNIYKALSVLKDATNSDRTWSREDTKKYRRAFADLNLPYTNPPKGKYENQVIAGDNMQVMSEMIDHGMEGKIDDIMASPNYDSDFYYSSDFNDSKPPEEYFDDLARPFEYYQKLLRTGGRVIYVVGNYLKNHNRDIKGDYNYDIPYELRKRVEKIAPDFRFFGHVIWNKGASGKNPLNTSYGTFCSAELPVPRSCHEMILVWSKKQFDLPLVNGNKSDISKEDFQNLAWSVWDVAPFSSPNNPHPCSYSPKLAESIIRFFTHPNDLVLESYNGAGVGCKACQKLNRRYVGIDLNKNYCVYAQELLKSKNYKVSKNRLKEILKGNPQLIEYLK